MEKPKLNDGRGLWDNEGICDHGIVLCNSAMKDLVSGQYLAFANKMEQIAKIFSNLKTGIKADRESLEQKIEELKRMNDSLVEEKTGLPVLKDGAENGSN